MLDAAVAAPGEEVCGLLLGQSGQVQALLPARNVARNPSHSFEIDPATLLRAHREARGAGRRVIGHWHSHPNGRAEPSTRDAARAIENGQIWLIVAGGDITAWAARATGGAAASFDPVAIEVM